MSCCGDGPLNRHRTGLFQASHLYQMRPLGHLRGMAAAKFAAVAVSGGKSRAPSGVSPTASPRNTPTSGGFTTCEESAKKLHAHRCTLSVCDLLGIHPPAAVSPPAESQ